MSKSKSESELLGLAKNGAGFLIIGAGAQYLSEGKTGLGILVMICGANLMFQ